jgi:hypothetical protein
MMLICVNDEQNVIKLCNIRKTDLTVTNIISMIRTILDASTKSPKLRRPRPLQPSADVQLGKQFSTEQKFRLVETSPFADKLCSVENHSVSICRQNFGLFGEERVEEGNVSQNVVQNDDDDDGSATVPGLVAAGR